MKLQAINITKSYDNKTIIENINLNLKENEIVSLLGISGVGKTTLFNILSGLAHPDTGNVLLNNKDITGIPGKVSYMLQKDLLFEFKTIIDNVSLPLVIKGKKKKEAREIAQPYFEKFGLTGSENKYPKELSGGMKQRAAFLRTYMFASEVFLLDEPFCALDQITKTKMYDWYLKISKEMNLSTIFVTHDIDEAILLSDKIYIMTGKPGTISKEIEVNGKPENVIDFATDERFLKYKKDILNAISV